MKKYFSIGEAAKWAHMTSETLRHYDRIGLVAPSKKDPWTNYRYYTQEDIVRLNAVGALQLMDLSLQEIKKVLEYDDLEKIIGFLAEAEKKTEEKIAALQYSKEKIRLAREDYERKYQGREVSTGIFAKDLPERVILLSDTLEMPAMDNLWDYLRHFYEKVTPARKAEFFFEDTAGIYTENGTSKMFAVCVRHGEIEGLRILPRGKYLCARCAEENRKSTLEELLFKAKTQYGVAPVSTVQLILVSGILQWDYELQVFVKENGYEKG